MSKHLPRNVPINSCNPTTDMINTKQINKTIELISIGIDYISEIAINLIPYIIVIVFMGLSNLNNFNIDISTYLPKSIYK